MNNALDSTSHLNLTFGLTNLYFDEMEKDAATQPLVPKLRALRDIVWPDSQPDPHHAAEFAAMREAKLKALFKTVDNEADYSRFMQGYAKMGELYDLAALLARDNFLAERMAARKPLPHGVEEYVGSFKTAAEAVEKLNAPRMGWTFTAHPTNNDSLLLTRSLRGMAEAVTALRNAESRHRHEGIDEAQLKLDRAMQDFTRAPLTPIGKKGEPVNNGVIDEAKEMLYFLGNAWTDTPKMYAHFDRQLVKKPDYDPMQLQFNTEYSSWGSSGDKDGNVKVNADTTLEAAILHVRAGARIIARDLRTLGLPELEPHAFALEAKTHALGAIAATMNKDYRGKSVPLPEEAFDRYSEALAHLETDLAPLLRTVEESYRMMPESGGPDGQAKRRGLVDLKRNLATFGTHMGRIEYRETSEELSRVVNLAVDRAAKEGLVSLPEGKHYFLADHPEQSVSDKEKTAILTQLIGANQAKPLLEAIRAEVTEKGLGHNFDAKPYKTPESIAYHTIKRLELARDHPTLVKDHVLAECQGLSSKMELLFLLEALEKNGRKPVINIIPLYERKEKLEELEKIGDETYANPVYRAHLAEVASARPEKTKDGQHFEEIQIAHSDNDRTTGTMAARAAIYAAHSLARAAADRHGVRTVFYQGLSQTDNGRGGEFAPTARTNAFHSHDQQRSTVQGRDLSLYFNVPNAEVHLMTRMATHCAKYASLPKPDTNIENEPVNWMGIQALKATAPEYKNQFFRTDRAGVFLGCGGQMEMNAGGVSSRGQRDYSQVFKQVDAELQPNAQGDDAYRSRLAVNPEAVRTITWSELLQHLGMNQTWFAADSLDRHVRAVAPRALALLNRKAENGLALNAPEKEFRIQLQNLVREEKHGSGREFDRASSALTAVMQGLYTYSYTSRENQCLAFKDAIDRMARGIAKTNFDAMLTQHPELAELQVTEDFKTAYVKAGQHVLTILGAGNPAAARLPGTPAEIQVAVSNALTHQRANTEEKRAFMEGVNWFKAGWREAHPGKEMPLQLARECHAALDTAMHGSSLMVTDPRYAEMKHGVYRPERAMHR